MLGRRYAAVQRHNFRERMRFNMSEVDEPLRVGEISNKYDRTYKARDRESDAIYEVNVARLECTCLDFMSKRAAFPSNDARRVCAHLYDKLYSTKAERALDPIVQLFIRYGRSMFSYRVVRDEFGLLIIGEPFGPGVGRALGVIGGNAVVVTYNVRSESWASGESELEPTILARVLEQMKTNMPGAFMT